jgi:uncharacterized protein YqhQ
MRNKKGKTELMIGGQAIIEGVMMRSKTHYSIAVREPNGKISVKKEKFLSITEKNKFFGLPIVRGIIALYETLILGTKALNYSANKAIGESDEKQEIKTPELIITFIISIALALALFKFLPLLAANFLNNSLKGGNLLFNIIDGITKIAILIGYLALIGLVKDVKILFQYHGAEHKAVACYEAGLELTPENAKKHSACHPRCGTSFILIVLFLSIIFYLTIPMNLNLWAKLGIRILFLPIIAGIAYEWIKFSGKHQKNIISRIIIKPGLLIQKLTTRKPTKKQLEVAIKALKAVL